MFISFIVFLFLQGNDVTEEDCSSPSNGKGNYGNHSSPFTTDPSPPFALLLSGHVKKTFHTNFIVWIDNLLLSINLFESWLSDDTQNKRNKCQILSSRWGSPFWNARWLKHGNMQYLNWNEWLLMQCVCTGTSVYYTVRTSSSVVFFCGHDTELDVRDLAPWPWPRSWKLLRHQQPKETTAVLVLKLWSDRLEHKLPQAVTQFRDEILQSL